MSYFIWMKIFESFSYLLKKSSANTLFNYSICTLLLHILMQWYSLNIIRNNAYLFLSFYQIVHFNNIRMINFFKSHYFSLNSFSFHAIIKFWFLINFDCILFHGVLVIAGIYNSISTLTNWFSYLIIIKRATELWYFKTWRCLRFIMKGVLLFIMLLSRIFQTISLETLRYKIWFFVIIFTTISLIWCISFLIIATYIYFNLLNSILILLIMIESKSSWWSCSKMITCDSCCLRSISIIHWIISWWFVLWKDTNYFTI